MPALTPRFHGNGFIQVYLNELTRMHIWSPAFPATRVVNAQIHDHRFWFTSKILLGAIMHEEYDVSTEYDKCCAGVSRFPHGLYETEGHSKVQPLAKVNTCRVELTGTFLYRAGDTYNFGGPGHYHKTIAHEGLLTVSIMTKVDPEYHSRIVALNDEEPDHAFGNQPGENALRAEVLRVFKLLV